MDERSVFAPFQSIGDDCEFALMQRHLGVEKIHLLQWASSSPEVLISMLKNNFANFGDEGTMTFVTSGPENDHEMIMHDHVYGLVGHTWIKESSEDVSKKLAEFQKRMRYLRDKLVDDLTDSNYIFVYRHMDPLHLATIKNISEQLARFGDNILLIVSRADQGQNPGGQVQWCGDRVLQGFMNERRTPIWLFDEKGDAWSRLCRLTLDAVCQRVPESRVIENLFAGKAQEKIRGFQYNIALHKPATQSSISEWSLFNSCESEAFGAVAGGKNGRASFHTNLEDSPWWRVDLGNIFGITEVRLYNRVDQSGVVTRASRMAIEIGMELSGLVEVYRRETDEPFGGIDGNPLIFKPTIPIPGRFVRIRLLTRNYLHLDQVEVYGEPLPNFPQPAPTLATADQP